jgi:hypothetical protein
MELKPSTREIVVSDLEQLPKDDRAETIPLYQWVVNHTPYFLAGCGGVAVVLGYLNDSFSIVGTPLRAFIASATIIVIWIIMEFLIKRYSPKWIPIQGPKSKIKSLGLRPRLTILGIIAPLWIPSIVNPIVSYFKIPEEVLSVPHLLYEYKSNYPQKYLRLRSSSLSSNDLESVLTLYNNSKYILENIDVKIYILCDNENYDKYTLTYYLNASEYMNIGSYPFSRLIQQGKEPLDLVKVLMILFKNQEDLHRFILPELGQAKRLPKFNKHCTDAPSKSLFIDSEKIPYKIFDNITPGVALSRGETSPHGFNGVMLKIIIDYDINDIQFRHLIIGGMYYQYGVATSIPAPDNEVPVMTAMSGFFKADNSLWKWKGTANRSFSEFMLPQRVISIVEEGVFRSGVRAPSQSEGDIPLQPEGEIPQGNREWTGPKLEIRLAAPPQPGDEVTLQYRPPDSVPMYCGCQNNNRTPQPSFKPLN